MKPNFTIAGYLLVLSAVSGWIVFRGASDSPYMEFRHGDAFVQVGLGVSLIVLWLQFSVWLAREIFQRQLRLAWAVSYVWVMIALFYLWHSPTGYVADITKFVIEKR